jgi:Cu2+-exporting ATPase
VKHRPSPSGSVGYVGFVRLGDGRLRIDGVAGSLELRRVIGWIAKRPEVSGVTRRRTGAIEVQYRDGNGAFLRSLEDLVYTTAPASLTGMAVDVVHILPGRARLRVTGGDDETTERLAGWLESQPGVMRASPSPASRSIVVVLDEHVTTPARLAEAAGASLPETWPKAAGHARGRESTRVLASTAVMGLALSGAAPAAASVGVALTAIPPVVRAVKALRERRASVDLLDVAAVSISIATGAPGTGAFITWLLSIGDLLLARTHDRARGADRRSRGAR